MHAGSNFPGRSGPSFAGAHSASRPSFSSSQFSGMGSRPSLGAGGSANSPRPSFGSNLGGAGSRPSLASSGFGNSPGFGGRNSPSFGGNSAFRAGGNFGSANFGGGNITAGNRTGAGIASRPNFSGSRPGAGAVGTQIGGPNRPGQGIRPGAGGSGSQIGGQGNRQINNRPIISGNNFNRGNINTGNVHIGNNNWNVNRPGGYWANRPAWNGNWANNWYGNHVNYHHYGWYHGPWNGNWGYSWYAPLAWGAVGWGLGALSAGWGYPGYAYSNPYYSAPVGNTAYYDYSQPITLATNNYPPQSDGSLAAAAAPPVETSQTTQAYATFDAARASFRTGDYQGALNQVEQAITVAPNDPMLHEFAALCYFAMGNYSQSAGILNNLLAVAPGMDWTSMSSLYPSTGVYEHQLQALQQYCQNHPQDAAAYFVLAYQDMVCGDPAGARSALQVVTQQQPQDQVAQRMLASLNSGAASQPSTSPPAAGGTALAGRSPVDAGVLAAEETAGSAVSPTSPAPASRPAAPAAAAGPTADLVGSWKANRDGAQFELSLDEGGSFTWKSAAKNQKPIELKGRYTLTNNTLQLESTDQGTMVAHLNAKDANSFTFVPTDSPPGDKGLQFGRVKV